MQHYILTDLEQELFRVETYLERAYKLGILTLEQAACTYEAYFWPEIVDGRD